MTIDNAMVDDRYLLPKTETLDLSFPSFASHAVGHYGEYTINEPIPASVWGLTGYAPRLGPFREPFI